MKRYIIIYLLLALLGIPHCSNSDVVDEGLAKIENVDALENPEF